jgi:PIN domain nuclease of toxin-antitoxin system
VKTYLLDTHLLIWSLGFTDRLPSQARLLIDAPDTVIYFSLASVWEVAIKHRLGRVDFLMTPHAFTDGARQTGFRELPIGVEACFCVGELPLHHRDPFDRMLVAQAVAAPMFLLTVDRQLTAYSDLVKLVG